MVEARTIFCDFDDLFEKYMKEVGFDVAARMAGVVMKGKNTIVGEWPLRLRVGRGRRNLIFCLHQAIRDASDMWSGNVSSRATDEFEKVVELISDY